MIDATFRRRFSSMFPVTSIITIPIPLTMISAIHMLLALSSKWSSDLNSDMLSRNISTMLISNVMPNLT